MELLECGNIYSGVFLGFLAVVVYFLCKTKSKPCLGLPGPSWRLPIVGHLHLLGTKPHLALTELRKRYGDIFTMDFGPNSAVILCGKETIKKACADSCFSGRPHRLFNSWRKHKRYFAFGHDEDCLRYRKLTMKAISTFAKLYLEDVVRAEANQLVPKLCTQADLMMHSDIVRRSVANVSYYMCFGRIKTQSDVEFRRVTESVENILNFASQAGFADTFSWATWIPSVNTKYTKFLQAQDDLVRLVAEQEKSHLAAPASSDDSYRDLCDSLKDSCSNEHSVNLDSASSIGSALEQTGMLIVAGTETVATSLNWALLLLATHLDEQEALFREISDGGSSGEVGSRMEAFLLETLRFSMASPLAMPHYTLKDTVLNGKKIPRDRLVLMNLWSGSRDTAVWGEDAEMFRPARFLTETGQVKRVMADEVMAFGSGKRRCAGEKLARAELSLFLSGVVSGCAVELESPQTEVDYWSSTAIRSRPPVIPLRFTRRE